MVIILKKNELIETLKIIRQKSIQLGQLKTANDIRNIINKIPELPNDIFKTENFKVYRNVNKPNQFVIDISDDLSYDIVGQVVGPIYEKVSKDQNNELCKFVSKRIKKSFRSLAMRHGMVAEIFNFKSKIKK